MNAAYCPALRPTYNGRRGVRNLVSGNRTRQTCGIFVPPRLESVYGLEGREILEYPPPFLRGSEPPSRPLLAIASIQKS